jgi:hypothetical protein
MARRVIPVDRFVAEINRRLPGKPGYRDGLQVFLTPLGATVATAVGYDWNFKDGPDTAAAVRLAVDEVALAFEVYPPMPPPMG